MAPVTIRHPVSVNIARPRTNSKHNRMLATNHDTSDVLHAVTTVTRPCGKYPSGFYSATLLQSVCLPGPSKS